MTSKRGKVVKYLDLYVEHTTGMEIPYRIQQITYADRTKAIQVRQPLTEINVKFKAIAYFPSYEGLRAMVDGLVDIHGKSEVERELNIKLGGETNGRKGI